MWIKRDNKTKEPEKGKTYWATVLMFDKPIVLACTYFGKGHWKTQNYNNMEIEAWWDDPMPEPMKLEKNKAFLVFPDFEVNERGINKKIKVHVLPEEQMRKLGFTDYREGYWYFCRRITSDISFSISINKTNTKDFRIDVLDDNFCQPYDYQSMLSKESYYKPNKIAIKTYEEVEKWMAYLEEQGIVSGHVKGEYI